MGTKTKTKRKKRKTKRGFRIFIVIITLLFLTVFSFYMLGAYVFKTNVRTVIVHDNIVLKDSEIIKSSGIKKGSNFFLTSSVSIKNKLKKNDFIKDVKVRKNVLFEIHLYVEENKPLFYREDIKKVVLNNKEEIDYDSYNSLDIPNLVNYVPNTKYDKLIEKLDKTSYEVLKEISDIKYDPNNYDEERFILYMNDENKVYINLPKFKSLNKYDEMVEQFEGKTGTLYLDSGNYFKIEKK